MIIVATHAALIWGKIYEAPTSTLVDALVSQKQDFFFLRHSLDWNLPSTLFFYSKGILISERKLFQVRVSVLRYFVELISTLFVFLFFNRGSQEDVFIWVDPLNALAWVMLKLFGRVKSSVFYTADYAEKRFSNRILNSAYHAIDRFCVKFSSQVWSVSERICSVRRAQWLVDSKNIFVPNVPVFDGGKYSEVIRKEHTLITLGALSGQLDFENLFKAIHRIKPSFPDIQLRIVWNGPKEEDYKKLVHSLSLESNVVFLWYLPHERALLEIAQAWVWLALYNWEWGFNYYWDSMKCREYFCFWLPVITTDTHSTVWDIQRYEAGVVCSVMSEMAYFDALCTIFKDYQFYSGNSIELGKKYRWLHEELVLNIVQ